MFLMMLFQTLLSWLGLVLLLVLALSLPEVLAPERRALGHR